MRPKERRHRVIKWFAPPPFHTCRHRPRMRLRTSGWRAVLLLPVLLSNSLNACALTPNCLAMPRSVFLTTAAISFRNACRWIIVLHKLTPIGFNERRSPLIFADADVLKNVLREPVHLGCRKRLVKHCYAVETWASPILPSVRGRFHRHSFAAHIHTDSQAN